MDKPRNPISGADDRRKPPKLNDPRPLIPLGHVAITAYTLMLSVDASRVGLCGPKRRFPTTGKTIITHGDITRTALAACRTIRRTRQNARLRSVACKTVLTGRSRNVGRSGVWRARLLRTLPGPRRSRGAKHGRREVENERFPTGNHCTRDGDDGTRYRLRRRAVPIINRRDDTRARTHVFVFVCACVCACACVCRSATRLTCRRPAVGTWRARTVRVYLKERSHRLLRRWRLTRVSLVRARHLPGWLGGRRVPPDARRHRGAGLSRSRTGPRGGEGGGGDWTRSRCGLRRVPDGVRSTAVPRGRRRRTRTREDVPRRRRPVRVSARTRSHGRTRERGSAVHAVRSTAAQSRRDL